MTNSSKTHTDLPLLPGGNNGNKVADDADTIISEGMVPKGFWGLDIGPKTIEIYKEVITRCNRRPMKCSAQPSSAAWPAGKPSATSRW